VGLTTLWVVNPLLCVRDRIIAALAAKRRDDPDGVIDRLRRAIARRELRLIE
jgi:hypothetical protein